MNKPDLQKKLIALRSGDKAAFEEIYESLKTPMYTIILRVTRDKALSEDILQEVFVKLYQSPPEPSVNPRAYLFQMARNLAIDGVRKQRHCENLADIENIVYLPTEDLTMKMDVEDALKTLPLLDSQIVTLRINGELKFREIAGMLNIPLGTVLWKYRESIKRLRLHLSGGTV